MAIIDRLLRADGHAAGPNIRLHLPDGEEVGPKLWASISASEQLPTLKVTRADKAATSRPASRGSARSGGSDRSRRSYERSYKRSYERSYERSSKRNHERERSSKISYNRSYGRSGERSRGIETYDDGGSTFSSRRLGSDEDHVHGKRGHNAKHAEPDAAPVNFIHISGERDQDTPSGTLTNPPLPYPKHPTDPLIHVNLQLPKSLN